MFSSINWRASLVPAAAVIPAPVAYIKVVAVKKLVVEILMHFLRYPIHLDFTLRKLERFKQVKALNILAWYENKIYIFWFPKYILLNRSNRGHSYLFVRGEILGFYKDELMRKHLSRMFSLIKNES